MTSNKDARQSAATLDRLLLQRANHRVWRVAGDDLRVVEHVELLRRIAAGVEHDRLLAAGVVGHEARHVEHLAVDDHPAVVLLVVLGNLVNGETTGTA